MGNQPFSELTLGANQAEKMSLLHVECHMALQNALYIVWPGQYPIECCSIALSNLLFSPKDDSREFSSVHFGLSALKDFVPCSYGSQIESIDGKLKNV